MGIAKLVNLSMVIHNIPVRKGFVGEMVNIPRKSKMFN